MQTQLSRYCKQEDMFNGHKLSGSCSNQPQLKIFPLRIWSSYRSTALTEENLKRLEEEYASSKEAFKRQRMQDYIEQTNLALFNKETTRRTSRDFVCDAEPGGASSSLPAKQAKIAVKFPERPLKKEEISTAPATHSPSAQPKGSVPKESRLLVQLGKKNRSDSPATVNQHKTTLPTMDAAAATRINTIRRRGSLFLPARCKHIDTSHLPCRKKAEKGN